jgi:hypothetical protein
VESPNPQSTDASANSNPGDATPAPTSASTVEVRSAPVRVEKAPTKKLEPVLSPKAAEYKGRIEEALSERGLASRARVQGVGNTLILAGKLRPSDHGALLKFLRDAPADVRIVDHIEYDDALANGAGNSDGGHPLPRSGYGAIHVVTDVLSASAQLHDPAGQVVGQCLTPCSFNNLVPDRYSLEVKKDGYQPVQTALQVRANSVADQKLSLESLTKGLYITSQPPGADVFINGAKQSGQTPVMLPLAPGQYNLVLRLQGYDPYSGSVQVKDNIQTQFDTKLTERSQSRIAFAQIHTNPAGAEIFVDGTSTGKFTPARIQVPTGLHTLTIKLDGFQQVRRPVQASEGGTVMIDETLRPK